MAILNIQIGSAGLVGVSPRVVYINTNDTDSAILAVGYLNHAVQQGFSFSEYDMCCVATRATPSSADIDVGWYGIDYSGQNWSLVTTSSPGDVVLPTVANHIAIFTNTTGTLSEDAATAINGGNIQAGLSGTAGYLSSFPSTASRGSLRLLAVANSGNTLTTISNSAMGQASVVSIPDPGAATATFLLDTGAANILAMQQFVGISNVLTFGTGTWTVTRIAQGNYVSRHTAGDETSIIAVDITPQIRIAASKGFRLDSFDYIYSIATLAMDAHSVTVDRIAYVNNVAVSVTSIPLTGTLSTATQANPYVTNVSINTPAFDITADSKYVIEITANNSATSAYDFYGLMLRFSQTIS